MEAFLVINDGEVSGRVPIKIKGTNVSCRPLHAIGCAESKEESIKSLEGDGSLFFRLHGMRKALQVLQSWGWKLQGNKLTFTEDASWAWKDWDELINISIKT